MVVPDGASQAEGLLEKIAETALDDDYYVVRSETGDRSHGFNTVLTGLVLATFAVLVSIAALQTRTDRPATERERASLIRDIAARKKVITARETTAERLRAQVDDLRSSVATVDPAYEKLRIIAADRGAEGPGITLRVTPGPDDQFLGPITDADLQILVNGLWYAGAEAVSINGQRIGSLTSIRSASGVIKVNYRGIGPPYTVIALGDDNTLSDRFEDNPAGAYWADRQENAGVGLDVTSSDNLSVGRAPLDRLTLRHATAVKGDA